MTLIDLSLPDDIAKRLKDATVIKFDFSKNSLPSETSEQFVKRMIVNTLRQWVIDSEVFTVQNTADVQKKAVVDDVNLKVVIS